jgi:hypothetical protein
MKWAGVNRPIACVPLLVRLFADLIADHATDGGSAYRAQNTAPGNYSPGHAPDSGPDGRALLTMAQAIPG